jgi:hypothetical protein
MSDADPINVPNAPFNTPVKSLWNNNAAGPIKPIRYLTAIPNDPLESIDSGINRTRILRNFGAEPSDLATTKVEVSEPSVQRRPLTGSFSAVRSARILHQYRLGFWSDAGVIDTLAQSQKSDPTDAEVTTMYEKFQVFSYLPAPLAPTQQEFSDAVTPSKAAAIAKKALADMGIAQSSAREQGAFPDNEREPIKIVADEPFAITLSEFCDLPI